MIVAGSPGTIAFLVTQWISTYNSRWIRPRVLFDGEGNQRRSVSSRKSVSTAPYLGSQLTASRFSDITDGSSRYP